MATDEQMQALLRRMGDMSAGDLSILQALQERLGEEETFQVTTTPGSDNDRLWTEMAALGWMTPEAPLDVPVPTKVFTVNAAAKEPLTTLLGGLMRTDTLTKLFNDLRTDVPPRVVDGVVDAGGSPSDVAMMLAGIVERTMRRSLKPEIHEEFLDRVAEIVREMLKQGPGR